ncbi:hypothetical protein [Sphingomonas sp. AX6]|uniref:hypothetical protein n=1 Tax=Sphingomonas sp. AX6 TaxID=2653171 RepID=UPI0012F1044B|nr:hypothetical protein [Sphingomonas sp. AX6]VXC90112.1 conserved hypothetical protein [Sphingomonas sp. AX6]
MRATYQQWSLWIGDGTGLPDTILHLHAGMAIFLIARVLSGRSLGSWLPITIVLIAALGKEVADRFVYGSWRWYDTPYDVLATMFWPTMLWLGIRIRPLIERAQERFHPHHPAEPDGP